MFLHFSNPLSVSCVLLHAKLWDTGVFHCCYTELVFIFLRKDISAGLGYAMSASSNRFRRDIKLTLEWRCMMPEVYLASAFSRLQWHTHAWLKSWVLAVN
jgi:hypothetical protein